MKRIFAAIAAAVVLTGASAQATTFPSLTRIYAVSGVSDSGTSNAYRMGTAVQCSNLSGVVATVRVAFFNQNGIAVGTLQTVTVANAGTIAIVTHTILVIGQTGSANTGPLTQGMAVVYSTQSGVHCSAMVMDHSATTAEGIDLHMVRYNAHPGTVE